MNARNKNSASTDFGGGYRAAGQDATYQRPFMDVRELISSLWREKSLVAGATALALLLAGIYLFLTPKTYTATAQLLIDLNRPLTGDGQSIGADTTRFMMGPVIDSQVEIIRANRIIRRVIESTGYQAATKEAAMEDPDAIVVVDGQNSGETKTEPPISQAEHTASTEKPAEEHPGETTAGDPAKNQVPFSLVSAFQRNLDVRRKGLTLILLVQFTDEDPVRAALLANTVVNEYMAERDLMEQANSKRAIATLQTRVAQARLDITKGEKQLQELSETNNLYSAGGITLDDREIADTATQLNLARTEESRLLADLQEWEAQSKASSGITTISKLTEARRNHVVVRNQIEILEKTLSRLKQELSTKSTAMNRYAELQKEVETTRENYLAMVNRVKQLETEQNYSMLDIQMLDSASEPQSPSNPNVPLVLAAGLLGGLGLGVATALIKDHVSTVLRTPLLVQDNLGVPHIASLNQLPGRNADPFKTLSTQQNSSFVHGILMIHRFLAENKSGAQRIIAIVSVNDGDGKSTVAAALAQYSASITHQRTALIDCDVHQRSLSKRFAPDAANSFAQAVNNALTPASVMTHPDSCAFSLCTAPWEENKLSNIETLMSAGMAKFVKTAAREYDLIILDAPGMLHNVEARSIVAMADLVVLVVDSRSTTIEGVAAAKDAVPGLENKLSGVVLNHMS